MFARSAGGRRQPFYHVSVDERDRPDTTTYVAQCNVEVLGSGDDDADYVFHHSPTVTASLEVGVLDVFTALAIHEL